MDTQDTQTTSPEEKPRRVYTEEEIADCRRRYREAAAKATTPKKGVFNYYLDLDESDWIHEACMSALERKKKREQAQNKEEK